LKRRTHYQVERNNCPGTHANPDILLRPPVAADAHAIAQLVEACKPLDTNSTYMYLLLCQHFSATCVLASEASKPVGFMSAYQLPGTPEVLFLWQIAVHPQQRGRGLAYAMLRNLLKREILSDTRYLEATVNPSNTASRKLLMGLAKQLGAPLAASLLFARELFGQAAHEDEVLHRIGPIHLGGAATL
jgi:L-2,4-diaminobutyric acid acetyltransferase